MALRAVNVSWLFLRAASCHAWFCALQLVVEVKRLPLRVSAPSYGQKRCKAALGLVLVSYMPLGRERPWVKVSNRARCALIGASAQTPQSK